MGSPFDRSASIGDRGSNLQVARVVGAVGALRIWPGLRGHEEAIWLDRSRVLGVLPLRGGRVEVSHRPASLHYPEAHVIAGTGLSVRSVEVGDRIELDRHRRIRATPAAYASNRVRRLDAHEADLLVYREEAASSGLPD